MSAPTMLALAERYLAERRRLGFALTIQGTQITAFARFADAAGHQGPLTAAIVLAWVKDKAAHATPSCWARRLALLKPFASYLLRLDPATEFPWQPPFGRYHRRLAPHIYTEPEISELLAAARRLPPCDGLRPLTYATLFGLIAATGLRISEALHLGCGDVDLAGQRLTIRQTKFRKSRLVPVHATVIAALQSYLVVRARADAMAADAPLFLSSRGQRLASRTVHGVFQRLRSELGWVPRGGHAAVRIHDLRHSFICRRVQLWQAQGATIDNAMAALSTYVGHTKLSDTYWYLTGVPELMASAGERFEAFASREDRHG